MSVSDATEQSVSQSQRTAPAALLTAPEVAEILRITPRTVWRWAKDGRIERLRISPRVTRFTTESVDALIAAGTLPTNTTPADTEAVSKAGEDGTGHERS